MSLKSLRRLAIIASILAWVVVMLGAYTRLTDAGLGCPDWPGCYGHMVLPSSTHERAAAQEQFIDVPIEARKAWTEMVHRYVAGSLALLIVYIAYDVFRRRRQNQEVPWIIPLSLLFLVGFQAALGMWTVTLKLLPVVVMGHLLGGITIFSMLCYFALQCSAVNGQNQPQWRVWVSLGIGIVFCQIALGGWVSSNYAGLACIGFPQCNGVWLPTMYFSKGFNLFSPIGANYQGGLLDNEARVSIQVIHRAGALITAGYVFILSLFIFCRTNARGLRNVAALAMVLVLIQFSLGILNVVYLLPLWIAVLHNGCAALLLGATMMMHYLTTKGVIHASRS